MTDDTVLLDYELTIFANLLHKREGDRPDWETRRTVFSMELPEQADIQALIIAIVEAISKEEKQK